MIPLRKITTIKKASKFVNAVNEFYFELEENLPSKDMKKQLWFGDNLTTQYIYQLLQGIWSQSLWCQFSLNLGLCWALFPGGPLLEILTIANLTHCRQNLSLFRTSQELNDTHRKNLSFTHISTVIAAWLLLIFYIYTIN